MALWLFNGDNFNMKTMVGYIILMGIQWVYYLMGIICWVGLYSGDIPNQLYDATRFQVINHSLLCNRWSIEMEDTH